jgi:hypothetical protein
LYLNQQCPFNKHKKAGKTQKLSRLFFIHITKKRTDIIADDDMDLLPGKGKKWIIHRANLYQTILIFLLSNEPL